MSDNLDEPPDENEAFENLDEALDDVDAQRGFIGGPEGERDLGSDLVVDEEELEEAGANLDDPDRMSLLQGGMDDPDGTGSLATAGPGTDEGDVYAAPVGVYTVPFGTEGDRRLEEDDDPAEREVDPELEVVDVDPSDLEDIPDDAGDPGSAHW